MKILESFEEFNKKMSDYDIAYENAKKVKDSIRKIIEELPDNPKINRLGGNAFTISSKDVDITKSLNAFYYDFKEQYKKISEYLDKIDLKDFNKKFQEIIDTGKFTIHQYHVKNVRNEPTKTVYKLNPKVIEELKKLI